MDLNQRPLPTVSRDAPNQVGSFIFYNKKAATNSIIVTA